MDDALQKVVSQLIGDRSVLDVARKTGVNHPGIYAILDKRSKRPSPNMLMALATELHPDAESPEETYKRLALAAYGVIVPLRSDPTLVDESALAPAQAADSDVEWATHGRRPAAVSTAT